MGNVKNEKPKNGTTLITGFLREQSLHSDERSFDWESIDAERLRELIGMVTNRGGAIRFGYSRDGNAGSIGIYYGSGRDTLYIRPGDNGEDAFQLIEGYFAEKPVTGGKSPE